MGIPAWVSRLMITLLALGFPVAIGLAWVFDITSEGIVRTEGRSTGKPGTSNRTLIAVTILAIAFGIWGRWGGSGGDGGGLIRAIAVLPLDNLSGDPQQDYFVNGMHDALISELSKISALTVRSRQSTLQYRDSDKTVPEIAAELGVDALVGGSVMLLGGRVNINMQLVNSRDTHLWTNNFDRNLEDVISLHQEVAWTIAREIKATLTPDEEARFTTARKVNPEAYDAYLRGWALVESFHVSSDRPEEKLDAAREYFEEALTFDPEYPLALAGLSLVETNYYDYGVDATPERLQSAVELAHRALALDPEIPEAHAALGAVYGYRDDFEPAIDEYRLALRLDPDNAYVWCGLAWACNSLDPPDMEAAERAAREAIRLEPGYFESYYQLGRALELQGRYGEAIITLEYTLQLNPASHRSNIILGKLYLAEGNYNQALDQFNEARRIRETPGLLILISAAYAALGDKEMSLANLEKALAGGYYDFAVIDANPLFASLRSDPRYQMLITEYEEN